MDSFRAFGTFFSASLALHVFLGFSLTLPWSGPLPAADQILEIDYVRQEQASSAQSVAVAPASAKPATAPKKKIKGIPIPRHATSDFQKIVDEKIKKQLQQIKKLDTAPPRVTSSMTSAELLSDPAKGKVFLGYFAQVKKKIQTMVYQKAGKNVYGRGTVCLGFVLSEDGELQKLGVLPKGTEADEVMKALALQCIRESSPFGKFPKDLGPGSVVFNITIFFDGGH